MCPHIELLIPVQCYSLQDFREFEKEIGGISFDGFNMPVRNLKIQEIAFFLIEFWKIGIKKVHLLGTSTFPVIALSTYFSTHFFERVSLDSVTWRITGERGIYLDPYNLSRISLNDDHLKDKDRIRERCRCQYCEKVSLMGLKHYSYKRRCSFLWTHNLHAIETACSDLHKHSKDLISLERFLKLRHVKEKTVDELMHCLIGINYGGHSRS